MTTLVSNTKTQPAIVMDKLHIDSLTFKQERVGSVKKVIGASGVLYGIDVNGDPVFDIETMGVSDPDIETTIVTAHVAAGGTVESFQLEYDAAKTAITDKIATGAISDAELMAYFEATLGRIFELHGKVSISGVE